MSLLLLATFPLLFLAHQHTHEGNNSVDQKNSVQDSADLINIFNSNEESNDHNDRPRTGITGATAQHIINTALTGENTDIVD